MSKFADMELVIADGRRVDAAAHLQGKIMALYLVDVDEEACSTLTRTLNDLEHKLEVAGKPFEVIVMSADREEKRLIESSFGMRQWSRFDGMTMIEPLRDEYNMFEAPALRIVNSDGTVVSDMAVEELQHFADGGTSATDLYEEWKSNELMDD
ncbi:hypothetical protein PENTCL1PPCAC_24325 [Pristionchus entomophagus]|uniref:Thioredoxin-like fold domain-containing protein n=1 Tax=Pristionchus entomophagus TaxID=358040 RepID=A0AAV5U6P4_9BILA|nr:hypothetical protein PENTCL1PPCAC_24325 [Pristionchus entomophagus]